MCKSVGDKKQPVRTCVCCRKTADKKDLIRVVRGADGAVRVDQTGKAAGRGAYICKSEKCVEMLTKTDKFKKALKCSVDAGIIDELKAIIKTDTEMPMDA